MITEGLVDFFAGLLTGIVGGFFDLITAPPGWFYDGLSVMSQVHGVVYSFDTWLPVTLAFTVAAAVAAAFVVSMVIGLIRVVVSYLTFGGGAT